MRPPNALRAAVLVALVVIGTALGRTLILGVAPPAIVEILCLFAVALATYAWVLFPLAGSLPVTVLVAVGAGWAWAARRTAMLGWELGAAAVLLAAAAVQRRRRFRRFHRMEQLLGDITEERTVKEQAIGAASQSREALQRKLSRYTQLQTIAEELSNLTDLTAIARLGVDRAFELIGKSDVSLLFLVDADHQELSLFASKRREVLHAIRAKHGDQYDRHVLRTHRPLFVNDVRRDFRFTVSGAAAERDVGSVVSCPLLLGQTPIGVLRLDSARPGAYTQDDLRFLDILLDLLSTAVTNAKLFAQTQQLAMTDGLTGLTLRRPFVEQLQRELARAARGRESVSVLMIDVDNFKTYNDTFGHTAGDLVLKRVAEIIRQAVPAGSVVGRYGGEEFVALLARHGRPQAADVAERMRHQLEALMKTGHRAPPPASVRRRRAAAGGDVPLDSGEQAGGGVTVSIGVASFPDDAKAELELIRVADARLYQAKRNGRNLVCST